MADNAPSHPICEDLLSILVHRYHPLAKARTISRAMRAAELPSSALDEADQDPAGGMATR